VSALQENMTVMDTATGDVNPFLSQWINDTRSGERQEPYPRFLDASDEESFAELFHTFSPQLVAYYRSRRCGTDEAEDLAQEVLLAVYLKATQLRDRALFRRWLYKIARHALCRRHGKRQRQVKTVDLSDMSDRLGASAAAGSPATIEFKEWMASLDARESEVMKLRFMEDWEYHEIATAKAIPIGTVQWRVFNAKKKLARVLNTSVTSGRKAG
jgi:RNA polymerase sigma-70 factor (ECF subfamily)